ncbi:NADPH-dependent oxidoreductase, partial [Vibrio metoecus]
MKLTIVSGSQRAHSQSLNVANYLKSLAETHFEQIDILDLHALDLPFWNEGVWQNSEQWQPWRNVAQGLKQSDAFVFITPEWHGMATPALKNFLLLTTDDELAHKPALLVSVSASINGVYPISELRMTGNKNNHVCFLPDHLIFRDCEPLITADHQLTDPQMQARSEYT